MYNVPQSYLMKITVLISSWRWYIKILQCLKLETWNRIQIAYGRSRKYFCFCKGSGVPAFPVFGCSKPMPIPILLWMSLWLLFGFLGRGGTKNVQWGEGGGKLQSTTYDFLGHNNTEYFLSFQTLQAAELIDSEFRAGMSSRQKNKAKRMAKLFAKQKSRDAVEANEKRYNPS